MPASGWGPRDRDLLRQVLREAMPPGALDEPADPAGTARRRLGLALARRDGAAVRALLAQAVAGRGPLAQAGPADRRLLAHAAAHWDPPALHHMLAAGWLDSLDEEQRRRLLAEAILAPPPGGVRPGRTGLRLHGGIPVVEAVVNGGRRGSFILDTGAPHTALSLDWCRRGGIPVESGIPHLVDDGSGRPIEALAFRLESLEAGAAARDVAAIAFAFPPGLDAAGILSPLDAFAGLDVVLDYRDGELAAGLAPGGGDAGLAHAVALAWSGGVPLLPGRVEGRDGFFLLDSGAGGELLCEGFVAAAGIALPQAQGAQTLTAAGSLEIRLAGGLALRIGDAAERLLPFAVKPCDSLDGEGDPVGLDGIVGAGWLAGRRLLVEAGRRRCRFSDPPA